MLRQFLQQRALPFFVNSKASYYPIRSSYSSVPSSHAPQNTSSNSDRISTHRNFYQDILQNTRGSNQMSQKLEDTTQSFVDNFHSDQLLDFDPNNGRKRIEDMAFSDGDQEFHLEDDEDAPAPSEGGPDFEFQDNEDDEDASDVMGDKKKSKKKRSLKFSTLEVPLYSKKKKRTGGETNPLQPNIVPFHTNCRESKTHEVYSHQYHGFHAIVLNRAKQRNALSLQSIRDLRYYLKLWDYCPETNKLTWLAHRGDKIFCSGSDVKSLYEGVKRGDHSYLKEYLHEEFHLWRDIKKSRTPLVSLLLGETVGTGTGFVHNTLFPIAAPGASYYLPETSYGLIPTAGSSYALSRLRGGVGLYLALTGKRIKDYNLVHAGLSSNYFISESFFREWSEHLSEAYDGRISHIMQNLAFFASPNYPPYSLDELKEHIENAFTKPTLDELLDSLLACPVSWGQETYRRISSYSPLAIKLTFELFQAAKHLSFEKCIELEYRLLSKLLEHREFVEGFESKVIENRPPKWTHKSVQDISPEEIADFFEPSIKNELTLTPEDPDHIRTYPRFQPDRLSHGFDKEIRDSKDTGEGYKGTVLDTGYEWKDLEHNFPFIEEDSLTREQDLFNVSADQDWMLARDRDVQFELTGVPNKKPFGYQKRDGIWWLERTPKEYDVELKRVETENFDEYTVYNMFREYRNMHVTFPLLRDMEDRY